MTLLGTVVIHGENARTALAHLRTGFVGLENQPVVIHPTRRGDIGI